MSKNNVAQQTNVLVSYSPKALGFLWRFNRARTSLRW